MTTYYKPNWSCTLPGKDVQGQPSVKWYAQGSSLSPVLFNMVINRLLQLDLGINVKMTAYADELAVHGRVHRRGSRVQTDDHRTEEDRD